MNEILNAKHQVGDANATSNNNFINFCCYRTYVHLALISLFRATCIIDNLIVAVTVIVNTHDCIMWLQTLLI